MTTIQHEQLTLESRILDRWSLSFPGHQWEGSSAAVEDMFVGLRLEREEHCRTLGKLTAAENKNAVLMLVVQALEASK